MYRKFIITFIGIGLISISKAEENSEAIKAIRASQVHLALAEPQKAQAVLIDLEAAQPDIIESPRYCYQRFFVALEGIGDRTTARLILQRLDHLVATNQLEADSYFYRSVTEAWYRALPFTDSDLPRLAHKKMTERLSSSPQP